MTVKATIKGGKKVVNVPKRDCEKWVVLVDALQKAVTDEIKAKGKE